MLVLPEGTLFGAGGVPQSNISVSAHGTTVTASSTANQMGAWSIMVDPTSGPSYGIYIRVRDTAGSGALTSNLVNIGIGPSGGGNEIIIIENLIAGGAPSHASGSSGGRDFFFPIYIPHNVAVSAQCQASVASDSVVVEVYLFKKQMYPVLGGRVSDYGAVTASSRGTLVTAGNGSFGTWTLLQAGGLERPHTMWIVGVDQGTDASQFDDRYFLIELGIGPDSSNVTPIWQGHCGEEGGEWIDTAFPPFPSYAPIIVDAAADLWCRLAQTGAAETRGVIAYGID